MNILQRLAHSSGSPVKKRDHERHAENGDDHIIDAIPRPSHHDHDRHRIRDEEQRFPTPLRTDHRPRIARRPPTPDRTTSHRIDAEVVIEMIADSLPQEHAQRTFMTFVSWAHYGDLFAYDETARVLEVQ